MRSKGSVPIWLNVRFSSRVTLINFLLFPLRPIRSIRKIYWWAKSLLESSSVCNDVSCRTTSLTIEKRKTQKRPGLNCVVYALDQCHGNRLRLGINCADRDMVETIWEQGKPRHGEYSRETDAMHHRIIVKSFLSLPCGPDEYDRRIPLL